MTLLNDLENRYRELSNLKPETEEEVDVIQEEIKEVCEQIDSLLEMGKFRTKT